MSSRRPGSPRRNYSECGPSVIHPYFTREDEVQGLKLIARVGELLGKDPVSEGQVLRNNLLCFEICLTAPDQFMQTGAGYDFETDTQLAEYSAPIYLNGKNGKILHIGEPDAEDELSADDSAYLVCLELQIMIDSSEQQRNPKDFRPLSVWIAAPNDAEGRQQPLEWFLTEDAIKNFNTAVDYCIEPVT